MHSFISPLALLLLLGVVASFVVAGFIVYGFYLVIHIALKWVRGHK